jgi:predicted component of type VI protein secretion system
MTDTVKLLSVASGAVIAVTSQQAKAIYKPPSYVPVAAPDIVAEPDATPEAAQQSYPVRVKKIKPDKLATGETTNGDPESPTIETEK